MRRSLAFLVLLALGIAAAGCGGKPAFEPLKSGPAGSPPMSALPLLSQLPDAQQPHRQVSAATYELLAAAPVMASGNGSATYTAGQIALDPSLNGGFAWAVFALDGFPDTTTVIPTLVEPVHDNACWLGFSDYQKQAWQLEHFVNPGGMPLTDGGRLISPSDLKTYVAIIASGQAVTATSLKLTLSADLPGSPVPHLSILSQVVAGMQADFNAATSDPGNGAITNITYDFGDATPPYETADPAEEVHHTYAASGPVQFTLTILNDQSRTGTEITPLTVADPMREILLVCNSDIPESVDLAAYYASLDTGRAVDPAYVLSLQLGAAVGETVVRNDYNDTIRDPIKAFLEANASVKATVKYILLCKGVPHRIQGDNAAVDSELCLLYSDLGPGGGGYPYSDWLINDPKGFVEYVGPPFEHLGEGFYCADDEQFQPDAFQVCYEPTINFPDSGDEVPYTLNYLVGRLDAYTYDEAKLIVDRSIAADTTGTGWIIFDSGTGTYGRESDTMVDPVEGYGGVDVDCGYDLLHNAGFSVYQDVTSALVVRGYSELPPGAADAVLGYCSWGVHGGFGSLYILNDLQFTYVPGACFMSYESYNATTFTCSNPDDPSQGHQGQGLIADFIHMGGTVAIGNAWEPYTIGVGDERWVYDRYINHGDRWIEAAYKGLRLMSWQEVVVGDPLCRVKP